MALKVTGRQDVHGRAWVTYTDATVIDGHRYQVSITAYNAEGPPPARWFWRLRGKDEDSLASEAPHLRCNCLADEGFDLRYGDYLVEACCRGCGHREEIYSG